MQVQMFFLLLLTTIMAMSIITVVDTTNDLKSRRIWRDCMERVVQKHEKKKFTSVIELLMKDYKECFDVVKAPKAKMRLVSELIKFDKEYLTNTLEKLKGKFPNEDPCNWKCMSGILGKSLIGIYLNGYLKIATEDMDDFNNNCFDNKLNENQMHEVRAIIIEGLDKEMDQVNEQLPTLTTN